MKLNLKNIGKIKEATVELNGITVIAGGNDTGKSTVGKALYCLFNSLYQIDHRILKEKQYGIENAVRNQGAFLFGNLNATLSNMILNEKELYLKNQDALTEVLRHYLKDEEEDHLVEVSQRVKEILEISDDEIIKNIFTKILSLEFDGQINNIFQNEKAEVELSVKNKQIRLWIEENKVTQFEEKMQLDTEVVYIDDPFIIDEITPSKVSKFLWLEDELYKEHREHLKAKITSENKIVGIIDSILVDRGLQAVLNKLNEVCEGKIENDQQGRLIYRKKDKNLNISNLSTGLKTFVILKILLEKGIIEQNGTIILDEPEIHLHPEWQLLFAELIVLLQKEFRLHILLNTHSPYFLKAIETYSAKYEIADRCKYYLSYMEGESSELEDVTTCTEKIYQKLTIPLETLQREIYGND